MTQLDGSKVAFLLTDGFEDSELTSPWQAVVEQGGVPTLISPKDGNVEGKNGHTQGVDLGTDAARADDFDALVLPGGVVNADHLRMDSSAVELTKAFFAQHKPVALICHGAWILTDADVLRGLQPYPRRPACVQRQAGRGDRRRAARRPDHLTARSAVRATAGQES